MTEVVIDPEFAALIPPLSNEERAQLEANLIADGCRDPLVVWIHDGQATLLDGHNRLAMCRTHHIPYITTCAPVETREGARVWIIQNQLGRRNLTPFARTELALALKEALAAIAKERQGTRTDLNIPQNSAESFSETRDAIAGAAGVSHDTVHKVETVMRDAPAPVIEAARSGDISVHRAFNITKALPQMPREVVDNLDAESIATMDIGPYLPTSGNGHTEPDVEDDYDYDGDEWFTPTDYLDAVRATLGAIDLDPASCEAAQAVVQAGEYYSKADDGLTRPWLGNVYLNPPYSMPLVQQFTEYAHGQYQAGNSAAIIILVNNCTDARWFQALAERYPMMFSRGRAKFWQTDQRTFATRQGQAIFYLGPDPERFYAAFAAIAYAPNRLR